MPCDQTIAYLTEDAAYTTQPREAKLFNSELQARGFCVLHDIPHIDTVAKEDLAGQNFYMLEEVPDEAVFRAGEPTW